MSVRRRISEEFGNIVFVSYPGPQRNDGEVVDVIGQGFADRHCGALDQRLRERSSMLKILSRLPADAAWRIRSVHRAAAATVQQRLRNDPEEPD
jgi:hypothetical protein